jgi:hypothetical protein
VSNGRIALVALTSEASAQTLAQLFELPTLVAPEAQVRDYALLAQIDFQHPLFAAFADPRFSDFTKIHFWKYRRLESAKFKDARIVATFDSGDPAILQVPLGKGSVMILTSSWRPLDSQLALSSKFVPMLHALLEQSSNQPVQKAQYFIGDEVPLAAGAQPLAVRKPDASEVPVELGGKFTATDLPGVYTIVPGGQRFAVNLAPDESRILPLPIERLTSLGVPLRTANAQAVSDSPKDAALVEAAELEKRQKLWRWAIAAALLVLLIETLFAGRLSRIGPAAIPAQT